MYGIVRTIGVTARIAACADAMSPVDPSHQRTPGLTKHGDSDRYPAYPFGVDEHYQRLRNLVLEALADNENGTISDDDLIYTLETTVGLLERSHEATRRELWEASADFDTARYAIPVSEVGPQDEAEEAVRQTLKAQARARARSALT